MFFALSPANDVTGLVGRSEDLLTIHSESRGVEPGLLTSRPERFLPCGLWSLCPSPWPHRVLGGLRRGKLQSTQGVRVAARRNLTQEPYTPRSAAGSAAGGRSLPRSLREGLRPHLPTGHTALTLSLNDAAEMLHMLRVVWLHRAPRQTIEKIQCRNDRQG